MKITLIGSTRFHERYKAINAALSKQGHVVYSVALAEKAGDVLTPEEKVILDLVHLRKISESDAVVLIGYQEDTHDYYIGESTRREIMWAVMNDKRIYPEIIYHPYGGARMDVRDPAGVFQNEVSLQQAFENIKKLSKPPKGQGTPAPGGNA